VKETKKTKKAGNAVNAKKAFASTMIALLAVVFVSGYAALLLSSAQHERLLLSSFESRKAGNHFGNAVRFLNASFRDALFDDERAGGSSLALRAGAYLGAAARELNASGTETNFTGLAVQSGRAPALAGFDYAVVANASFALVVRQGSAFKREPVFLEQRIDVNDTGGATWTWRARSDALELTVRK
jgi:hypothetical protein